MIGGIMSILSKNTLLLIISVLISGGTFYAIGRGPIAGLQEAVNQGEIENLALQGQVEALTQDNIILLSRLEEISDPYIQQ